MGWRGGVRESDLSFHINLLYTSINFTIEVGGLKIKFLAFSTSIEKDTMSLGSSGNRPLLIL